MKFKKWVQAQGGSIAISKMLGISRPRVNHWLYGNNGPKAVLLQKLVQLGKGAFNYDDVINETTKKRGLR